MNLSVRIDFTDDHLIWYDYDSTGNLLSATYGTLTNGVFTPGKEIRIWFKKSENMIRICDMDIYNPELPTIEVYAENYNIEEIEIRNGNLLNN